MGVGRTPATQQAMNADPHLLRGLVGEGHRQDLIGTDLFVFNQMSNPEGNDACLAAAGSRQDQQGSFDRFDGLQLFRIELSFQSQHGERGWGFPNTKQWKGPRLDQREGGTAKEPASL